AGSGNHCLSLRRHVLARVPCLESARDAAFRRACAARLFLHRKAHGLLYCRAFVELARELHGIVPLHTLSLRAESFNRFAKLGIRFQDHIALTHARLRACALPALRARDVRHDCLTVILGNFFTLHVAHRRLTHLCNKRSACFVRVERFHIRRDNGTTCRRAESCHVCYSSWEGLVTVFPYNASGERVTQRVTM